MNAHLADKQLVFKRLSLTGEAIGVASLRDEALFAGNEGTATASHRRRFPLQLAREIEEMAVSSVAA
jgi:hypothetical protein